jgi:hypothetical protein
MLSYLSPQEIAKNIIPAEFKYSIDATYVSYSMEPIKPSWGPPVLASRTFDDVKQDEQFDIILIPGGMSYHQPRCIVLTDLTNIRPWILSWCCETSSHQLCSKTGARRQVHTYGLCYLVNSVIAPFWLGLLGVHWVLDSSTSRLAERQEGNHEQIRIQDYQGQ